MNEWGKLDKPCPTCGFVEKNYNKPPRWLPLRHILNGKYMVGKVIGEGGFGITYLGWDLNLQVRVAIKEYFPVSLATRDSGKGNGYSISSLPGVRKENYRQGLEKFMMEAKNLSKFYNLPGIVAVKDFFFENDTAYMVMEYVDGITLSEYIKKKGGRITEQETLSLIRPVIESLKIVHQSGIIHRDISPDNIMITQEGNMKLIDFGAARFASGDNTERSLTIILKHGYAPAEQYQSHGNQGAWTDVYAICATMYRMITGSVPPSAMDRLHNDTLADFKNMGFNVSEQVAYAIIDKGLAIKVENRYQNMDQLLQGLYYSSNKKVHRVKKDNEANNIYKYAMAGGAVLIAVVIVIVFGVSKHQKALVDDTSVNNTMVNSTGENTTENSQVTEEAATINTEYNADDILAKIPEISMEELAVLQSEATQKEGELAAAGYHMLIVKEDGTVASSGDNSYEQLEVNKWKNVKSIATASEHTVGILEDGTAIAAGSTTGGRSAVSLWKNLIKVATGEQHTLGLQSDGTVVAAGSNTYEQCMTGTWTDIISIAAGENHSLGLKADGTVVAVGSNSQGQCDVSDWKDVVEIYSYGNMSMGLKSDGTVLIAGNGNSDIDVSNWKQVVSLSIGNNYVAGLLSNGRVIVTGDCDTIKNSIGGWTDIECIASGDETLFAKKKDGSIIYTAYEYGNVTLADFTNLKDMVCRDGYMMGLKEDGTVVSYGMSGNDFGISDLSDWNAIKDIAGNDEAAVALKEDGTILIKGDGYQDALNWTDIVQVVMTDNILAGLKEDGTVVISTTLDMENISSESWENIEYLSAGYSQGIVGVTQNGTLVSTYAELNENENNIANVAYGDNHIAIVYEDGTVSVKNKYGNIVSSSYGNVSTWRDIVGVACGESHTIGLKSDGTVSASGSNSNGQCDVGSWSDVEKVYASSSYTVGITADGELLRAGKLKGEY
jgi:serine/threonine protein kinase/alpha-tubulin suppressor-like RCC1 family protein